MPDPTILTSEPFGTYFWFRDLGGTLVERPLREMTAVEVLWAWRWQCERARRQHRPG